jgi:hypothetical protein
MREGAVVPPAHVTGADVVKAVDARAGRKREHVTGAVDVDPSRERAIHRESVDGREMIDHARFAPEAFVLVQREFGVRDVTRDETDPVGRDAGLVDERGRTAFGLLTVARFDETDHRFRAPGEQATDQCRPEKAGKARDEATHRSLRSRSSARTAGNAAAATRRSGSQSGTTTGRPRWAVTALVSV